MAVWVYGVPVDVSPDGTVTDANGVRLGYVWKGTRLFSPPTHKGSRVVKYHKEVACWYGSVESGRTHEFCEDTRKAVLDKLILEAGRNHR